MNFDSGNFDLHEENRSVAEEIISAPAEIASRLGAASNAELCRIRAGARQLDMYCTQLLKKRLQA